MFYVRYIHSRPSHDVQFFASSSPQLTERVQTMVNAAPGFAGQVNTMSADFLVNTVDVAWETKAAYLDFERRHHSLLRDYREARLDHDEEIEGSTTIQFFHADPSVALAVSDGDVS